MVISRNKLNTFEVMTAYTGFSLYAGWVTAASILNVSYCVKGLGLREDNINIGMEISESKITCVILWVA